MSTGTDTADRLVLYEQRAADTATAFASLPESAQRLVSTWLPAVRLWGRCKAHAAMSEAAFVADVEGMVRELGVALQAVPVETPPDPVTNTLAEVLFLRRSPLRLVGAAA